MPAQTSFEFDPQRDSDSTATKDGSVPSSSSLETDVSVDFVNNTAPIADQFYDSLLNNERMEIWGVQRSRRNSEGKYFAWYMRGVVSEDDNSNDADSVSERSVSFSIDGDPKRGWLALSEEQQEEIDYLFRGLDEVSEDEDGNEENGGVEWAEDGSDDGEYLPDGQEPVTTTTTTTTSKTIAAPTDVSVQTTGDGAEITAD